MVEMDCDTMRLLGELGANVKHAHGVIDRYTLAPPITDADKDELLTAICNLYPKDNKGRWSSISHRFFLICSSPLELMAE
jgi:hypothetical protein